MRIRVLLTLLVIALTCYAPLELSRLIFVYGLGDFRWLELLIFWEMYAGAIVVVFMYLRRVK